MHIHTVEAYNTSAESDNKIHDDTVARKYGFSGGLVPGVEVYAYLTTPLVEEWGIDWLERGTMTFRLKLPAYDGETVSIEPGEVRSTADAEVVALRAVNQRGQVLADGEATLPHVAPPPPLVSEYEDGEIPSDPPPASFESLPIGRVLGAHRMVISAADSAAYRVDVRDPLEIYADEHLVHPGSQLRPANYVLSSNVVLGPWIHVSSAVTRFGVVRTGEELVTRARVTDTFERKGHQFVELDQLMAVGDRVVQHVIHTAIFSPRARV